MRLWWALCDQKGYRKLKEDEEDYLKHSPVDRAFDSVGKVITVFLYSFFGFVAGIIFRLFSFSTTLDSISSILWQYLPFGFLGAVIFGALSYKYSRVAATLFCFIPGCEISV